MFFPSTTKSGPGRVHTPGHKRPPKPRKHGAGPGFVQRLNPDKPDSKRDKHRAGVLMDRAFP